MRDFRQLRVWHRSHTLALAVTRALASGSKRGLAHVVTQGQRSAHSVPANIVEGCAHESRGEFARYLRIALASAHELEYHLVIARDLGVIAQARYDSLTEEVVGVKKMLVVLIQRVRGDGQ